MADLLIKHLREKTQSHSALSSLYSQWDFDQKLIPKALQTVGVLFSHYSRHDESHSKQILVNIERILGANISLLSATDTWLILEAAYWHDIGMVVPQSDMTEALKDSAFGNFLSVYCNNPHHELHHVAVALKKRRGANAVFDEANPIEMVTKFKELMAEWFRQKHPERANAIVKTPMQSIGVNSPRTELIPSRLFRVLGKICLMHGVAFKTLMDEVAGLPYREAGLAQDDCHPRFVACLLRMGDLLDLDDNRFCPVMQHICGDNRPALTLAHEEKHSAIRHLRVDQEKIEVTAECETVDGYLETFKWFEWLKQEMQDQMSNWRDIVPDRALGLLPTLGKISVSIGGNLQLLRDGERPSFGIDISSAIELLQGKNLYDSEFACIREALQNAVDATLLKIWVEASIEKKNNFKTPASKELLFILDSNPIIFNLTETDEKNESDPNLSTWVITIKDSGTGISKTDLEHMLKIGGSKRNQHRQNEIESMPEWLKPSGTFGIGLQSLFMLTDSIQIKTKSIFTNEALRVTLHSPTGSKQGLVTLNLSDNGFSVPFGTELSFIIKLQKYAKSYTRNSGDSESLAAKFANKLDPILDHSFPYQAAKVFDAALKFNEHSLLGINGVFKTVNDIYTSEISHKIEEEDDTEWRFVTIDDFHCNFCYEPRLDIHPSQSLKAMYRGQEFEIKGYYFPNVYMEIDILSGKAGEWLNFNRDKISDNAQERLHKMVLSVLHKCVEEDLSKNNIHIERSIFSMFLKGMALTFGGEWLPFSGRFGNDWLDTPIHSSDKTYRNYFDRNEWYICENNDSDSEFEEETHNSKDSLILSGPTSRLTTLMIVNEWTSNPMRSVKAEGDPRIHEQFIKIDGESPSKQAMRFHKIIQNLRNKISLKNIPQDSWDQNAFATEISYASRRAWGNCRFYFSANGVSIPTVDLRSLTIKNEVGIKAFQMFSILGNPKDRVVLPFLFLDEKREGGITIATDSLDELCKWLQPNLIEHTSIEKIKDSYEKLINYIDEVVMKDTIYWSSWSAGRGLKI